jgi:Fic family protein
MTYNKDIAYNSLPLLPPNCDLENKVILKKTISANKALAELRGWTFAQPNPFLLLDSLSLQEAKASSEIENVVTTNDELYQALATPLNLNISPATKEVLHYKEALWFGFNKIKEEKPLTVNVFIDLFRIVKKRSDGIRCLPGTVLKNAFNEIVYTPPDNEHDILRLLSNLENYINTDTQDDIDPLIKLAIIHYQFECIHPFPDGNGRVGRIVNVLYLVQKDLLVFPILYLSNYIIENKFEYYKALKAVTENNDWEKWILYILDAVEQTSTKTLNTIKNIYKAQEDMRILLKEKVPQIYSKELVSVLFERPYCKIDLLVKNDIAKSQTASKYLKALYELGLLDLVVKGREKYYINKKLWEILTK